MKKLILIVLFSTIISFFNSLFAQKKLQDVDVFKRNPSEVISFDDARTEGEKILQYLIQEQIIPGASVTVAKQGKIIWQRGYGYADITKKTTAMSWCQKFPSEAISKSLDTINNPVYLKSCALAQCS